VRAGITCLIADDHPAVVDSVSRYLATTSSPEDPIYVWGKGFIAAKEIQPGDRFRSDDGRMVTAEEVVDTGVVEEVYNCAVADYHTYFVGSEESDFSVWAHNACNGNSYGCDRHPASSCP